MGKRVKFSSTSRLVNELSEANAEGRIAAMLKGLARNDMIILNEWGYLPTDPDGATRKRLTVNTKGRRHGSDQGIGAHPARRDRQSGLKRLM